MSQLSTSLSLLLSTLAKPLKFSSFYFYICIQSILKDPEACHENIKSLRIPGHVEIKGNKMIDFTTKIMSNFLH